MKNSIPTNLSVQSETTKDKTDSVVNVGTAVLLVLAIAFFLICLILKFR